MPLPPYLTQDLLDDLIARTLDEDVGAGDVTTLATVPPETTAEAHFLAKQDGVLAGLRVAEYVFAAVDAALSISWTKADGEVVAQRLADRLVEDVALHPAHQIAPRVVEPGQEEEIAGHRQHRLLETWLRGRCGDVRKHPKREHRQLLERSPAEQVDEADDAALAAVRTIHQAKRLWFGTEGGATIAALPELADHGWIRAGDHVVVVNTGSLFKYFRREEVDDLAM